MDLKRHVQDAIVSHGARFLPPMPLVVSRRAPLAAAYTGVASAPAPQLLGRSMSVLFEGEDGVGDGVSREAAQVMMNAVLDGPEGRPEEALFVPWPPPEDGAYSDPDGGQPSVSEAHGGGGANASKPSVWDFNEADEIPDPFDPDFDQMMAAAAAAPTPALLRTINPDVPAAHMKTVFRFVGRLIGMTIASSKTVTLPLAPWIWAAMLGRRGTMQQLESVDEEEISRTMMRLHTHPLEDELNAWAAVHPPSFSRTVAIPASISRARARAADTARNASTCAPPSSSSDVGEATSRALDETPNTVPETSTAAAAAAAAAVSTTAPSSPSTLPASPSSPPQTTQQNSTALPALSDADAAAHRVAVDMWRDKWEDGHVGFHLPRAHHQLVWSNSKPRTQNPEPRTQNPEP